MREGFELTIQFLFLVGRGRRHHNLDSQEKITVASGSSGEALALQSKLAVGPASRRNFHSNRLHQRGGHYIGAQGRFPREDGERDMNIAPLSAKHIVRSDCHTQVQIAWLAAVGTGLSLPGNANPRPILDSCGDSDFDCVGVQRGTLPLAGWTGTSAKGSAPVTGRAGPGLL